MISNTIYLGSWFQRTSLHLGEIKDFVEGKKTVLGLDKTKTKKLLSGLQIKEYGVHVGELEYIKAKTKSGIIIKIVEDGLITLSKKDNKDSKKAINQVRDYYEKRLSPALKHLFSLGAPIPKELADIKNVYPFFVVTKKESDNVIGKFFADMKERVTFQESAKSYELTQGDKLYVINSKTEKDKSVESFIEHSIFMREFRGQMHRYLNIHRIIWERIAEVKERGVIKGRDIGAFKAKIDAYSKSLSMIESRINQMDSYVMTRDSILKQDASLANFKHLLNYKYETLDDTLGYLKEIWSMTIRYVNSASDVFKSLQAKANNTSLNNLTIVTSMGVGATLIGILTKKLPSFSITGVVYVVVLALIGYITNKIMAKKAINRNYKIRDIKADKNI